MRSILSSATVLLATCGLAAAQAAPRETVEVSLGGKKVAVEYGRPSLGARSFDELLAQLPQDRMWRAGSEQITTLTTETDVMIGGQRVPAGKYSLYVHCPESGDYALAVNRVLGQPLIKIWAEAPPNVANEPWPHSEYQKEIADQEVARATMQKVAVEAPVDRFTIALEPSSSGATLQLSWGDRSWEVGVEPAS